MHSFIALDWIAIGFLVAALLQLSLNVRLIAKALGLAETLQQLANARARARKRLGHTEESWGAEMRNGTDGTL